MLFGIPPSVTINPNRQKATAEQAEAIREYISPLNRASAELS